MVDTKLSFLNCQYSRCFQFMNVMSAYKCRTFSLVFWSKDYYLAVYKLMLCISPQKGFPV